LGHTSVQIIILGGLVIFVAIIVEFTIVIVAAQTTNFFRRNRKYSILLDRISGSVLVGLGIRLALIENTSHSTIKFFSID